MARMANEVALRCGVLPAASFSATDQTGDWVTFHVPFSPAMPSAAAGQIRVIVSASDVGVDVSDHQAAPVAVVGEVSPLGFAVWARNSDVSSGVCGLSWVAVAEVMESPEKIPRLRAGLLQPQHFQVGGYRGDWRRWAVGFGQRVGFADVPVVVVSPTNLNVRVHAAATVGAACGATKDGFNLAARNADVGAGACNFFYLAADNGPGGNSSLQLDTGQVPPRPFAVSGVPGDWQVWAVQFAEPFLAPPVVLTTADNGNGSMRSYARAAQGVIFDVSADGFTLAARNTDTSAGPAGFSWLAVGQPG